MQRIVICALFLAALSGIPVLTLATTEQKVTMMLGGQYCDLYLGEVESALKKLTGVKAVDFNSMKGHAVVTIEGGKTTANQLAQVVNGATGDRWHCNAQVMK